MKSIRFAGFSFVGRRKNNQDSILQIYIPQSDSYFFAVADGMGGTVGGQEASRLVIKTAEKIINEELKSDIREADLKSILERIYLFSQEVIRKAVESNPSLTGMGTTLVCLLIYKDRYVWGNLGDSRLYRLDDSKMTLITKDHSFIQDFIDKYNEKVPENILTNYSNYLMKSLDGGKDLPDIYPLDKSFEYLKDGSAFLLCSDGLIINKATNTADLFKKYILGSKNSEIAAKNLISLAFENGSMDNISAIVVQVGKLPKSADKIINLPYPPKEKLLNNTKLPASSLIHKVIKYFVMTLIILLLIPLTYFSYKTFFSQNIDNKEMNNESLSNKPFDKQSEEIYFKNKKVQERPVTTKDTSINDKVKVKEEKIIQANDSVEKKAKQEIPTNQVNPEYKEDKQKEIQKELGTENKLKEASSIKNDKNTEPDKQITPPASDTLDNKINKE